MIEATYIVNETLNSLINAELAEDLIFYPGTSAPEEGGRKFAVWSTRQSTDFLQYWIHTDKIIYRFVHEEHEVLQRIASLLLSTFNVEDIENHTFVRQPTDPNIRFQATEAKILDTSENHFSDQTKYYTLDASIMVIYTIV